MPGFYMPLRAASDVRGGQFGQGVGVYARQGQHGCLRPLIGDRLRAFVGMNSPGTGLIGEHCIGELSVPSRRCRPALEPVIETEPKRAQRKGRWHDQPQRLHPVRQRLIGVEKVLPEIVAFQGGPLPFSRTTISQNGIIRNWDY